MSEIARWTYASGSVIGGLIEYDSPGTAYTSHHDSDPARGSGGAFDLVRLSRFGSLDAGADRSTPVQDLPSYRAMVELVASLPECSETKATDEFEDLGPLPTVTEEVIVNGSDERFRVVGASEFSSGPPVDWLVRGVLPRAELAVVYGESGSGKSFLALDLAAAISRGINWREKRTTLGRVVYVCAEGAGGFKARLRGYAQANRIELQTLSIGIVSEAPNLLEQSDAAALYGAIIKWGKPDVIVIDTLSATTPGGNENSGESMGLVLSHCKLLHKKTGALVVLIHHSGKDATKGARGWSGLRAAADAEIEVTRNGDFRTATVTKLKDAGDFEQFSFKLNVVPLGDDAAGEPVSSCVVEHIDSAPIEAGRKPVLKGLPKLVHDTLAIMAPSGTCNVDDLIEGVKAKLPRSEGARDLRRQNISATLSRTLLPGGYAFMHSEDRIGLTNIKQLDEEPSWA